LATHSTLDTETRPEGLPLAATQREDSSSCGFVVLFSTDEPNLTGAWLACQGPDHGKPQILGRGRSRADDAYVRLELVRQRPRSNESLSPFSSPHISRSQLHVRTTDVRQVEVTKVGRASMLVNGLRAEKAVLRVGDILEVGNGLVLMCTARPRRFEGYGDGPLHPYGTADPQGYVGESSAAWALRRDVAFVASHRGHVLVLGRTGTGKELVARAIHSLGKAEGPLVPRNASTIPESLADAELFGNVKGYPNPSMPERRGLVGEADGGTLFLDEFADLGAETQAHLLRVLDDGEYQRLGEATTRRSTFRLVAATNRDESSLRPDLRARFDFCIHAPSLAERREDIVLIVRHLLSTMTEGDGQLAERFLDRQRWPRMEGAFVRRLAQHEFLGNVRELRQLLWRSLRRASDDVLTWPQGDATEREAVRDEDRASQIRRVLEANNGSIERSWRALGLSSRHAMSRMLKRYGIAITRRSRER
jgi:two-component system nitrogen regulation response regulator GlnG/two-component system response regulator HydG